MNPHDDNDDTVDMTSDDHAEKQQFIDFLDSVEADLQAASRDDRKAALEQILAAAGYRRERDNSLAKATPYLPHVPDLTVRTSADIEEDQQFQLVITQDRLRVARQELAEANTQLEATLNERAQALQVIEQLRQRSDEIWADSDATRREATEALKRARQKSEDYLDGAIKKAEKIIKDAEAIRFAAGEFADALVADAAAPYALEHALDHDNDVLHAIADRQENLLAFTAASSSGSPSPLEQDIGATIQVKPNPAAAAFLKKSGQRYSSDPTLPGREPPDPPFERLEGLSPHLHSTIMLIIAFDSGGLRLISPHNSPADREEAWLRLTRTNTPCRGTPPVTEPDDPSAAQHRKIDDPAVDHAIAAAARHELIRQSREEPLVTTIVEPESTAHQEIKTTPPRFRVPRTGLAQLVSTGVTAAALLTLLVVVFATPRGLSSFVGVGISAGVGTVLLLALSRILTQLKWRNDTNFIDTSEKTTTTSSTGNGHLLRRR